MFGVAEKSKQGGEVRPDSPAACLGRGIGTAAPATEDPGRKRGSLEAQDRVLQAGTGERGRFEEPLHIHFSIIDTQCQCFENSTGVFFPCYSRSQTPPRNTCCSGSESTYRFWPFSPHPRSVCGSWCAECVECAMHRAECEVYARYVRDGQTLARGFTTSFVKQHDFYPDTTTSASLQTACGSFCYNSRGEAVKPVRSTSLER